MRKILNIMIIISMMIIISCKDGMRNNNAGGGVIPNPPTPPTPPAPPITEELKEIEILNLFGLQKGQITASAAAKKITNGMLPPSTEIIFTERKIISYNDETGEFKIRLKGTKKDGIAFDKIFSFVGFTHPLQSKTIQSLNNIELSLDEGIEHNYSLDKYIEKLNKSIKQKTMVKDLSFMLSNSSTIIELGEYETYTLRASAVKNSNTEFSIKPQIVYLKLLENTAVELEDEASIFSFTHLSAQLKKNYFTEIDVFRYVLNKIDETSVIKENKNEFASSFYAFAKKSGVTPINIFSETFKTQIKHYQDIYKIKDENEHLQLDIDYGIYQPKSAGIKVDDYKGSLEIKLCIATKEQITDQSGIMAIKTIKKEGGFASIPDDATLAKNTYLFFNLTPKNPPLTEDAKNKWKKSILLDPYYLLRVNEDNGTAQVKKPFSKADDTFHLCLNGTDQLSTQLGCSHYGASKTIKGKVIFIENIQLKKVSGSENMDVLVTLKGENAKTLKITITP